MKLRVTGAAAATASAAAPTATGAPPPPPPQTPPPSPPSFLAPPPTTARSPDLAETGAGSPSSGAKASPAKATPRHRQDRILAAPRAARDWFRHSLAWLRRAHFKSRTHSSSRTKSSSQPDLNSPNTRTHKHNKTTSAAKAVTAASRTPPSVATIPTSSTSTVDTTRTAACTVSTASTASTVSFSGSLDDLGMASPYSNTSADSGVVPSFTDTCLPSTSQKVRYQRRPAVWGKPRAPCRDRNLRCDRSVAVPTVEQCMEVISVPPNSTLMHSGGVHSSGALRTVLEQNREYLEGYTPLSYKHTSRDFSQVYANVPQAWSSLSTALATLTSGVVYVLLPDGAGTNDFPQGGHFAINEWPYLIRNAKVTCVIRINASNHKQELIYARADQRLYLRQPVLVPEGLPDREFGYPLATCPTLRNDFLKPPLLPVRNISPQGRCLRPRLDSRLQYTSDERSRGRPLPAKRAKAISSKKDGCVTAG